MFVLNYNGPILIYFITKPTFFFIVDMEKLIFLEQRTQLYAFVRGKRNLIGIYNS